MNCPRCNSKVENQASFFWFGFIGEIVFPKYVCPYCGKLELKDFQEDVRRKMIIKRVFFGVIFFILIIIVIIAELF